MPCPVALVVAFAAVPPHHAPNATYDDLFHGWMQLRGEAFDYKPHSEQYLQLHRKDTWARVKGNEFKLETEKAKAADAMKRRADRLDLSQDITLTTRLTFGKYDFAAGSFPLTTTVGDAMTGSRGTLTTNSYWFVKSPRAARTPPATTAPVAPSKNALPASLPGSVVNALKATISPKNAPVQKADPGQWPDQCKVYFANPELLSKLQLVPEAAERLLAGRKESERVLSASVKLRLVKANETPGELVAEVQSVTFTDTIGRKPQLLTVTKPTESTLSTGK